MLFFLKCEYSVRSECIGLPLLGARTERRADVPVSRPFGRRLTAASREVFARAMRRGRWVTDRWYVDPGVVSKQHLAVGFAAP